MTFGRKILIFIFILLPVLLITAYSFYQTRRQLINKVYEERRTLTALSAAMLNAKLNHLNDIGLSLTTRPVFRNFVNGQQWNDAIALMQEVPQHFPFISSVFITDTSGNIMASVPENKNIVNVSEAGKDWYKGIRKNWQPYLSGVYKRKAEQHIVAALAVAVKNAKSQVTGILILEVNVPGMLEWSSDISIGKSGFVYIVDQKGHIAANPDYSQTDSIIDYSAVPAVQKALQGQTSTEVLYNPIAKEQRLSSYQQIPRYKWAVIVQQQATSAFYVTSSLRTFIFFYAFIILLAIAFAWLIVKEIEKRKKSEKQLSTYADMVDNTHLVIRGIDDKITFWNKGMEELYGWKKNEVIGKISHELFATQFPIPLFEIKERLLSFNQWQGELKHSHKDGRTIYVSSHWYLHRDEQGNPVAVIETNNDISALKLAEEKLKKSEESIHLLIDNVKDYAIFMLDSEGKVATWNNGAEHIKGYSEKEIIGKPMEIFYSPEDIEAGEPRYNLEMAKQFGNHEAEGWRLRKDGTKFLANVVFTALKDENGLLYGYSKITRDVTERKKAQEEMEFLSRQINQANDAIYILDEDRKIKSWNRGAEKLYGYTKAEVLGKDANEILKTALREHEMDRLLQKVAADEYITLEVKRTTRAGKEIYVSASSTTIKNEKGIIIGYVSVNVDITEQKELLRQVNHLANIVEQSTEAIFSRDFNQHILSWNKGAEKLFGFTKQEAIGKTAVALGFLHLSPQMIEEVQKIMMNKGMWQSEMNFYHKNGSSFYGAVTANVTKNEKGDVTSFYFMVKDISLRKQLEEQLLKYNEELEQRVQERTEAIQKSEKKYQYLFDSNPLPMWMIHPKTMAFIDVNKMAIQHYGYSREEFLSMTAKDIRPAEDIEKFIQLDRSSSRPDIKNMGVWNHKRKDGSMIQAEIIAHTVNFNDDPAILILSNDVTDKIKAELKLIESEKRFRSLIENNYDIISLMDESFKIIYRSPSATRAMGWTNEEIENKDVTKDIHPEDLDYVQTVMQQVQTSPGRSIKILFRTLHKNGHYLWMEGTIVNLLKDEHVKAILVNFRDVTERIYAEERLASSELRFRSLIENSAEGISLLDAGSNVIYRSPSADRILGNNPKQNTISFAHPDNLQDFKNKFAESLSKPGKAVPYQVKYINGSGNYIWAEGTFTNLLHLKAVEAVVANYHDISERVQAEEKLKASEEQFRHSMDNMLEGVQIHDFNWKYLYVNNALVKYSSFSSPDELLGYTLMEKYPGIEQSGLFKTLQRCMVERKAEHLETEFQFPNGTKIHFELSIQPVPEGIFILSIDISERKKAEEQLKASEEQFRHSMDNMLEGVQIIGFDWRYIYVNDAMARHGKYSKDELIGHTVMEKYPGIEQTGIFKIYEKCFNERVAIHLENEFIFPDDSVAWFELSFLPVPEGIFILSIDITERKHAEEKIKKINAELEERVIQRTTELRKANEELEAFSYSVSHDLRAPLRAIIGFSAILEEDYSSQLDNEAKRITSIIKTNTSKMGNLIDDLLTFSRMGRQDLLKINIDTNQLVNEIKEMLDKMQNNGKKIQWLIHSLPFINADISTIRQVWVNLLSNAFKYSGNNPAPKIEVGAVKQSGQTTFYVKDNGVGFDEKYKNKLFKVFQRLHSADEFEGTGIGLAIVEKIVSKHGGRVWAEAEINKGAVFYFSLPEN